MRVIGVDPGSVVTGYGLVRGEQGRLSFIAAGVIRNSPSLGYGDKLLNIYQHLCALIRKHAPDAMSLERSFVASNVQSAFRLGEVRALALLAAASCELPLFEYAPAQVKLAVASHGRADKAQVKFMVRRALQLDDEMALTDDAADALALAMCHLGRTRWGALATSRRRKPLRVELQ
ncbi:MAG TPA: crossover junction endodeoxyribonuclease RuvC [Candidatus Binataceae bacterium]|nr:crossover junction endodeoxyribonuclease RuvC [Candidatus Binataceae bacterium]